MTLSVALAAGLLSACDSKRPQFNPPVAASTVIDPIKEALLKVEEDRGQPTGVKAAVTIPAELKHYGDTRRFLSIQAASSREQGYDVPRDMADLARLIRQKELVELPQLGDHYVLYGIGEQETEGPLTHYDSKTGASIPLLTTDREFKAELQRLDDSILNLSLELASHRRELSLIKKRERARRRELLVRTRTTGRALSRATSQHKIFKLYYSNKDLRRLLALEHETLSNLAAELGDRRYDFNEPASRREFKVRLLSFARPKAVEIIRQIAKSYKDKYKRSLPITSLVRTEEYQRRLSRRNSNAARNSIPPHTTGLAFDVYYYFMTGEEQDFVMSEIAKLKAAGLVEALRENRSHIHVFAFADGRPPPESLVSLALGEKRSASRAQANSGAPAMARGK